jgi:hypothetical protein
MKSEKSFHLVNPDSDNYGLTEEEIAIVEGV